MFRKLDDFVIDKVFQKIANAVQMRTGWNCFRLANKLYKLAALLVAVVGLWELVDQKFYSSVSETIFVSVAITLILLFQAKKVGNTSVKEGALNNKRFESGSLLFRLMMMSAALSIVALLALKMIKIYLIIEYPVEDLSKLPNNIYFTVVLWFWWMADYLRCCTPLPPAAYRHLAYGKHVTVG